MRFLLAFFLSLFVALPAHAVVLTVTSSTNQAITVSNGGGEFTLLYSTLRQGNDSLRAADLQDRLNSFARNMQLRSGLDIDDPDKIQDPGLITGEREYWCDADGLPTPSDDVLATHMCSRADIVSDVFFNVDGVAVVTIRSTRDCAQDPTFPSCQ